MFSSSKQIPASDAQGESLAFRSGLLVYLIRSVCSVFVVFFISSPSFPLFCFVVLAFGGMFLPPAEELELLERHLRNYKSG